jgi:hypothetical protein
VITRPVRPQLLALVERVRYQRTFRPLVRDSV